MSHISSRPTTGSPSAEGLLGLGPKLLLMSMDTTLAFMREAADIIRPVAPQALSALRGGVRGAPTCEVPERECPPRCVCVVDWRAIREETVRCRIRVINDSRSKRTYAVRATPFESTGQRIEVEPASLELEAGGSAEVDLRFTVARDMPLGSHVAEIQVRGTWQQCVCVRLRVQESPTCVCEVVQGDPPVRIRAHRWYDHFQCEEPCQPPVRREI